MKFMTPLRWKIAAGYCVAAATVAFLWKDLASGWAALATLMTPLFTFLTALVTLKFGVVFAAMWTFLIAALQAVFGLIVAVSKIGVIKGLFLPWVLAGLQWLHDKSEVVQRWVQMGYGKGRALAEHCVSWWRDRNAVDRILLLGFVGPLVIVVALAVLIKKFAYMFISKKAAEQLVQRATKSVVKNFHRVPVVGEIPQQLAIKVAQLKKARDRKLAAAQDESGSAW